MLISMLMLRLMFMLRLVLRLILMVEVEKKKLQALPAPARGNTSNSVCASAKKDFDGWMPWDILISIAYEDLLLIF